MKVGEVHFERPGLVRATVNPSFTEAPLSNAPSGGINGRYGGVVSPRRDETCAGSQVSALAADRKYRIIAAKRLAVRVLTPAITKETRFPTSS